MKYLLQQTLKGRAYVSEDNEGERRKKHELRKGN